MNTRSRWSVLSAGIGAAVAAGSVVGPATEAAATNAELGPAAAAADCCGVIPGSACWTQNPEQPEVVKTADMKAGGTVVGRIFLWYSETQRCVRTQVTLFPEFVPPDGSGCTTRAHVYKPSQGIDTAWAETQCDVTRLLTAWVTDDSIQQMGVGLKYINGVETAGGHTDAW